MEQSVQQHGAVQEQLKEKYPIQRSPYILGRKMATNLCNPQIIEEK
jgi:hypothetical protein